MHQNLQAFREGIMGGREPSGLLAAQQRGQHEREI